MTLLEIERLIRKISDVLQPGGNPAICVWRPELFLVNDFTVPGTSH